MPEGTETQEKFAIRVLRRLENGTVGVFYIDAQTGELLNSLDGYELVSAGNLEGGNEVEDTETETGEDNPRFGGSGYRTSSSGGGGSDFLRDPVAWKDSLIPQLFPSTASWFGGEKAKEVEDKVAKSGGVIQPIQPTNNSSTAPNAIAPNAMDMGKGLASVPPELVGANDSSGIAPNAMDMGLQLRDAPTFESPDEKVSNQEGLYQAPKSAPVQTNNSGAIRDKPVDPTILGAASVSAKNIMGEDAYAIVNSGGQTADRNPLMEKKPGGWTGTEAHNIDPETGLGQAADIQYFSAPGVPATQEEIALIVADQARMGLGGFGYAENYMGPNTVHSDLGKERSWGGYVPGEGYQGIELDPAQKERMEEARAAYDKMGEVIPGEKPNEDKTVAQEIIAESKDSSSWLDDPTADLTNAGTAASHGLSRSVSQAELEDLAYTMAGELGPNTLQGVVAGDPAALAELASAISTYENRLQSGSEDVLRGSHYNANLDSNEKVTSGNYGLYGSALKENIEDFYSGNLAGLGKTDSTHYYNPDVANPAWGPQMQGASMMGDHLFGTLPGEYQTNVYGSLPAVQQAAMDRINSQAGLGGMDNSSLRDSSPVGSNPISSYYGDDGSNYNTPARSGNEGFATTDDILSGLGSSSSSYSSDSGGGQFDFSSSSGGGQFDNSSTYSPATGSNSPGGSGSNTITSSPPSIDTSGVGSGPSDSDIADNNAGLSGWDGWI